MSTDDRTVHASHPIIGDIVRYDQAGKWYLERPDGSREHLSIREAAECATSTYGWVIHWGRLGGRAFDRAVDALLAPEQP